MLAPGQVRTGNPLQSDLSAGQGGEQKVWTTCQPEAPNTLWETMMTATKFLRYVLLLLWLVSGVVACALKSRGVVHTQRGYDEVFQAALAAVQEAEFTVMSQANAQGVIVAEKLLPAAAGDTMQMTVRINQEATGLTVVATVVQPPGASATGEKPCKCHVKRFVAALESRMPDIQVVSIQ
jgi:hypothetical protein